MKAIKKLRNYNGKKRGLYNGLKVTPENRWRLIRQEQTNLVIAGLDSDIALVEAKAKINRDKKRYKAWLANKEYFYDGFIDDKGTRVRNKILV